jgi:hypothetical protein
MIKWRDGNGIVPQVAVERDTDLVFAVYQRTLNGSRHEMRLVCCSCPTKEAPLPTATVEVPQSKTGSFKLVPLNSALTITGDIKIEVRAFVTPVQPV